MLKAINGLCWLTLSNILHQSVPDTQNVIRSTYQKAISGEVHEKKYSPTVKKAMDFYVENIDILEI